MSELVEPEPRDGVVQVDLTTVGNIRTVGDLRRALAPYDDDTPIEVAEEDADAIYPILHLGLVTETIGRIDEDQEDGLADVPAGTVLIYVDDYELVSPEEIAEGEAKAVREIKEAGTVDWVEEEKRVVREIVEAGDIDVAGGGDYNDDKR